MGRIRSKARNGQVPQASRGGGVIRNMAVLGDEMEAETREA